MPNNKIQILPIIASVGIGAAAYSMMTGRGGQLSNMIPQFSTMGQGQGKGSNQNQSMG
ncbi:hypothetical protein [Siminovitchia acidinfaciens]|uniref:hypothetical protein n=1 Tax=Siminovitchia acidinfaciens TaxID=2321395 RepID=UPI0013DFEAA4|nr:hypothetical protein [Siminovitchia acidinfaciens]